MSGQRWEELLNSMKKILGELSKNAKNVVTVVNFSSECFYECVRTKPNGVNVNAFKFQGASTNYVKALTKTLEVIQMDLSVAYSIIFMSDGISDCYPIDPIKKLKDLQTKKLANFKFYGIEFHSRSDDLKKMCKELDGKTHFAEDEVKLTKTFYEIIEKDSE